MILTARRRWRRWLCSKRGHRRVPSKLGYQNGTECKRCGEYQDKTFTIYNLTVDGRHCWIKP